MNLFLKTINNQRGCFGGSPDAPPVPTPAPQLASGDVTAEGDAERRRRRAKASNTIFTGSQGVTPVASGGGKSLLGTS